MKCWEVIKKTEDQPSLEEKLNIMGKEILFDVKKKLVDFHDSLDSDKNNDNNKSEREEFTSFLQDALTAQLENRNSESTLGRDYWHCWDLRFISCELKSVSNDEIEFYNPIALSTSITLGMIQVNKNLISYL